MTTASTGEVAWQRLSVRVARADAAAVADALEGAGAVAVTLQDGADEPIYEPPPGSMPVWQSTCAEGLFDAAVDWQQIAASVSAALGRPIHGWRCEPVADQVWERAWMDRFAPMRFGRRLWICPSAYAVPEQAEVVLRLDPGLAFGTGSHATTALCLEAIERQVRAGMTVLDYGCGSGVLGIAALLLGAARVQALDIDPQALLATQRNAVENGVSERLQTTADASVLEPADLLVANILCAPLVALAPRLGALTRPGGRLVLSGILAGQVNSIEAAYAPAFDLEPAGLREDWACVQGLRRE